MPISRITKGVNDDVSVPAIEMRLRSAHQGLPDASKPIAVNTTGSSPIDLGGFGSDVGQKSTAAVLNGNNSGVSVVAAATPAATARLLNISTRGRVQTGDDVLIGGFIIKNGTKQVVLRGIGPSLAAAGVPSVLADPVLELHRPNGKVTTNDDWPTARADVQTTGIPPGNVKESAIVAHLPSGNYTVILRGKNNTGGIGLVEVYDLDSMGVAELVNISSRGIVGIGDNVLIGGIIVGPSGAAGSRVLARAIGPSLARSGVTNPLLDPTLELHDKNGVLIAANDNWKDTQKVAIQATTAPPNDDRESALLLTVAPGNYTAIVRGRNGTAGIALVEVYNLH